MSNNCLERLYMIITKMNNSIPKIALCELFEIDVEDRSSILTAYAELYILCNDCRKYIQENQPNNPLPVQYIDSIIEGLNLIDINDASPFHTTYFSKETLSGFLLLSSVLPKSSHEFSTQQISEIHDDLNNLLELISSASINENLRTLLAINLKEMLNYINKYRLFGSEKFINSLEKCTGSIFLYKSMINTEEEMNICKKILKFAINSIAFLNNNLPLINHIEKLFL